MEVRVLERYEVNGKKYRLVVNYYDCITPYSIERFYEYGGTRYWMTVGKWYSKKGNAIRYALPKDIK